MGAISNNPDTWELPPAAPNYVYSAEGVLESGATSTLVIVRDPVSGSLSYNTSVVAFDVSAGLVPLNLLALNHCQSTLIADILICQFQYGDTDADDADATAGERAVGAADGSPTTIYR